MPEKTFTVVGVRVSDELVSELEDLLRPIALSDAREGLERAKVSSAPADIPEYIRMIMLDGAQSLLDRGGEVSWRKWTVMDADGITRDQREAFEGGIEYRPPLDSDYSSAQLQLRVGSSDFSGLPVVTIESYGVRCSVTVDAGDDLIKELADNIHSIFLSHIDPDLLPPKPVFKVFIGHGRSPQWKRLRDRINATEGMTSEAFESIQRAGYHTLVVVDKMVRSSTVGVVIMTAEDFVDSGKPRARENVIHEVGFCQGALGVANTIVVMERGASEPTNIAGLTQIRFRRGRLRDVEDDIIAALELRRDAFEYDML